MKERSQKQRGAATQASRGGILTIGHSTRPIGQFVGLLQAHGVDRLVDVRTIPRSRHNPQFNQESLSQTLGHAGVEYRPMPGLGGLRRPRPDSLNRGWRNLSFRGFADYMQTPEFAQHLDELIDLAKGHRVALMCAEAVPWRCHRSLIADALSARGITAEHIMSERKLQPHRRTRFARVRAGRVRYPGNGLANSGPVRRPSTQRRPARA